MYGYGVEKNCTQALTLSRKAAEAGDPEGMTVLGYLYQQFYLAAVAQNLKRLVRFLAARPQLAEASN